jgi:4,5-dihydroxyphthalate decarboxylase
MVMTTGAPVDILFEAQAALPNFRYDIIQPLLQGRVELDGFTLRHSGYTESAGYWDNPKFKTGDFGLLDTNVGDVFPAIEAGWDMVCLPIFNKRKPVYNYLWVRADRGINAPKDLEGKTLATVGYASSISTYTRGFLQRFYGVDLSKVRWLSAAASRLPMYRNIEAQIDIVTGPRKSPVQRLMDGEVDGSTGDITDASAWAALESNPNVKRMFPDYQQMNLKLFKEHGIFTPTHIIVMGGKLYRQHPGLARKIYDAFVKSKEVAINDAMGDGSSYSLLVHSRELMRDQLKNWGDIYPMGIANDKNTIDWFLDFNLDQGLTKNRMTYEQIFAKETLDT